MMPEESAAESLLMDDVRLRVGGYDDVYETHGNQDVAHGSGRKIRAWSESSDDDSHHRKDDSSDLVKPLMSPRQRSKSAYKHRVQPIHVLGWRVLSLLLFVAFLAIFAYLVVYLVNHYGDQWLLGNQSSSSSAIGCSRIEVEDVWVRGIPKLMTESSFRLLDVNNDGVLDILFGFATGGEGYNVPNIVCDIYFGGKHPCLGGLIALDGRNGREIWRHYTPHEIFSVSCEEDLNQDGLADCVIAGRVGTMEAVDSVNGQMLWNFTHSTERVDIMNLYTAQFIRDLDGDGVSELLNIHGGDPFGEPGSKTRLSGKLLFFSGRTGNLLKSVPVPDERESYYSPVIYKIRDGTEVVLFGTGGETHPGSLWYISLMDLYKGNMLKAKPIYSNKQKGVMTPPVLIDLTRDGVKDIVFSNYNSTVLAYDGQSYRKLWNFSYPMSETYASPAPGFFNDDDVPDFMVHWQHGPGFPVYYHAISTVLDGATGQSLLQPFIRSSIGAQSSPLTISVEGRGNDIFLYWMADCLGHEGNGGEYDFVKGTNVHEKSRSDVCRLRFKSEGVTYLYALNQHLKSPGRVVYSSVNRFEEEHASWVNTSAEARAFLLTHEEYADNYNLWEQWITQQADKARQASRREGPDSPTQAAHEHDHHHSDFNWDDLHPAVTLDMDLSHHSNKSNFENWREVLANEDPEILQRVSDILSSYGNEGFGDRRTEYEGGDYDEQKYPADLGDFPTRTRPRPQYPEQSRNPWTRWQATQRGNLRGKRHVGIHDEGGLQRLISTGTLAPPLLDPSDPNYAHSMDVVFATYWFYPAKTKALLPEDQACIDAKMAEANQRFDPNSKYFGMDDDGYEHAVEDECLESSAHQLPEGGTYNSQSTYNPYRLNMGQLTVYRIRLKCACEANLKCSRVLPFSQQQWPSYMGRHADGHWTPSKA